MGCLLSKTTGDNIRRRRSGGSPAQSSPIGSTLAADIEYPSLSLDFLKIDAEFLFETDQEGVQFFLDSRKDVWKTKDLFDLVREYFEGNLLILDTCTTLGECLKRARDSQLMLQVALQQFEQEQEQIREEGIDGEREHYVKTLQELRNFKAAGNPFDGELLSIIGSVIDLFRKLQVKRRTLDRKLRSIKAWRKVLNVIFGATVAAALICTAVVGAIAAPPVVTASVAAAAVTLGSMGTLFNLLWKKYENEIRREREVVNSMNIGAYVVINDIGNIKVFVNKLVCVMEYLMHLADFGIRVEKDAAVLAVVVNEIRKNLSVFMQTIDDLGERADISSRRTRMARTVFRRIKNPSSS